MVNTSDTRIRKPPSLVRPPSIDHPQSEHTGPTVPSGTCMVTTSESLQGHGSGLTRDKHDLAMSYAQVMHHFALVSLGTSLEDSNGVATTNSLKTTLDRIRTVAENRSTIARFRGLTPRLLEPSFSRPPDL